MQWAYKLQAAIEPFAESGVYTNFLGDEGEERDSLIVWHQLWAVSCSQE